MYFSKINSPFAFLAVLIWLFAVYFPHNSPAQTDDYQCIWHTSGATDTSGLGHKLVAAGDQNMDGYDDILVANWGTGEVFLYFGGNPMDTIPDMVFTEEHIYNFGYLPLECRDLNGDTYPDFTIGSDCERANSEVYVYFGGPLLDNQWDLMLEPDTNFVGSSSHFGYSSSMGDFNGDGYDDLIIGAPAYNPSDATGKIFVFYGGPDFNDTPDFTITGEEAPYGMIFIGYHVSCSGNVNNDEYNDILLKGWYAFVAGDGRLLFNGSSEPDSLPDWSLMEYSGSSYELRKGSFIIPDFTGDGCDEIVLGGILYGGACSAFIFYGGEEIDTTWNFRCFGWGGDQGGCAYAGDVNNDGWPDILLGNDAGRVQVYYMYPELVGLSQKSSDYWIEYPGIGGPNIGYAGDVNGDGVDDFMFATYSYYDYQGDVFIYSDPDLSGVKEFKIQNSKFYPLIQILSILPPQYPST